MNKNPDTIIFLHIPKAAGTTLLHIINRHYSVDERYAFGADAKESVAAFKALPAQQKQRIRMISGHMGFGLHQDVPYPTSYITILRDPIERVISYYHHVLRNPTHYLYDQVKGKLDLATFADSQLTAEIDNGQTRLLAGPDFMWTIPYGECTQNILEKAKRNLREKFSVVGIADQFDQTLILLKLKFGWDDLFYTRANVTEGRPEKKNISAKAKTIIERDNQLDIQLYQYGRELLNEQIRQYGYHFKYEFLRFRLTEKKHILTNRL